MDHSPPGSSVHGILQTRILEWVACLLKGIFPTQGGHLCLLALASKLFTTNATLVAQRVKHLSTIWETQVRSLDQEVPWRRKWQSTPVLLPGISQGQRILVGYSPWRRKESDTTE